jgi:(1->4)-alpha-D-glucan 1-alpha-D-glucosylmutase
MVITAQPGRIKQFVIARVLAMRKKMPRLFAEGTYVPLETAGPLAEHFVGFTRILGTSAAIAVFCRFTAQLLSRDGALAVPISQCNNTRLVIPAELRATFSDALIPGRKLPVGSDMGIAQILTRLPIAFLIKHSE